MKHDPGITLQVRAELERIRPDIRARVNRLGGFSEASLLSSIARPRDSDILFPEHIAPDEVIGYTGIANYHDVGVDLLRAEKVAFVILAGGRDMLGRHDALEEIENTGLTQLDVKLAQAIMADGIAGRFDRVPTWIMTQPETVDSVLRAITTTSSFATQKRIEVFEQFESYRLFMDCSIAFASHNEPLLYPTGNGDVIDAILSSGLFDAYPNVEYLVIVNSNNIGADVDPALVGHHALTGAEVTCELVPKLSCDPGSIPIWSRNRMQLAQQFLLPVDFDIDASMYVSTNSMIFSVNVLKSVSIPWVWYARRRQVGQALYVQHERALAQVTEKLQASFIVSSRARYVPRYMRDAAEIARVIAGGVIVQ